MRLAGLSEGFAFLVFFFSGSSTDGAPNNVSCRFVERFCPGSSPIFDNGMANARAVKLASAGHTAVTEIAIERAVSLQNLKTLVNLSKP